MKITNYLFLFLTLSFSKNDKTECLPRPNDINIEIIDKISGENVFTNDLYEKENLQIITNPENQLTHVFISWSNI